MAALTHLRVSLRLVLKAFEGNEFLIISALVIWNSGMRLHLQNTLMKHLGDFPLRLHQNVMEQYDFCPMPKVTYEELENDLFCLGYYLKNLCDEEKFPDWPIREPMEVFRECLLRWTKIIDEGEGHEMKLDGSTQLMGLKSSYDAEDLRQAYCNLAKECYHDTVSLRALFFTQIMTCIYHLSML